MDMELITAQIARLELKPTDTLVVRCNGISLSGDVAATVRKIVQDATGHAKVLVIDGAIDLTVLQGT